LENRRILVSGTEKLKEEMVSVLAKTIVPDKWKKL